MPSSQNVVAWMLLSNQLLHKFHLNSSTGLNLNIGYNINHVQLNDNLFAKCLGKQPVLRLVMKTFYINYYENKFNTHMSFYKTLIPWTTLLNA
jgi:pectate lyase